MGIFLSSVCRLCGACEATAPYFCASMCNENPKTFAKMIKYTMVLKYHNKEQFDKLATFPGMVGRFCNNKGLCTFRKEDECRQLDCAVRCYEMFLDQCDKVLTIGEKSIIYESFSGIDMKTVGLRFTTPKKPFKGLKKKAKNRISRFVDKSMHNVLSNPINVKGSNKSKSKKVKVNVKTNSKPITTTFFYGGSEEWRQRVESILGENHKTNEASN